MRKNKNLLKIIPLGLGLTVLSCTNDRKDKVENVRKKDLTDEEQLIDAKTHGQLIEREFVDAAKTGTFEQLTELYYTNRNFISDEVIQRAIDIALENANNDFFIFFEQKIFPEICADFMAFGITDLLDFLLVNGRGMSLMNIYGYSPLHMAVNAGCVKLVEYFVDNGISVNIQNRYGEAPLHLAAQKGVFEVVKCLIDKGADLNIQDSIKRVPLHWAIENKHTNVIKILIDRGTNLEVRDHIGATPLHVAVFAGNINVIKTLIDHNVNLDAQDDLGWTPLHCAVEQKRLDIIKCLVENGADLCVRNDMGLIPLELVYLLDLLNA